MRKFVCLMVLALCASTVALAQDTPKGEFSAGYSFVRIHPGGNSPSLNLSGWIASIAGNVNDWFGIVGELSGHYGSPGNVGTDFHTYLFGPRISYRENERFTPFAHILMGAARLGRGPATGTTDFGMALGGGVDVTVNDNIAIRAGQMDYLMTRFGPNSQHNIRLSAGLTIRFAR